MSKLMGTDLTGEGPKRRRRRRIELRVLEGDWRSAERLARMRTLGSLEEMLTELVADMATAYERPGSWEAGRIWDWLDSHYEPAQFLRLAREN